MSDVIDKPKGCVITFVGDSTPKEMFEELKLAVIDAIDVIDDMTFWQNHEPQWWLDMMELEKKMRK